MDPEWLTLLGFYVILLGASSAQENSLGYSVLDFVGCFKDERAHALPYDMGRVNNIVDCIDVCRQNELPYAGLQRGDECHCGTDYAKYGKAANCNKRCRSMEICGGDMANSVYKVGAPLLKPTLDYIGCYKDTRKHALSTHIGRSRNIEDCIEMCRQNTFEYAGIERGEECYCGTNFDKYGKTKICKVRCRSGEICGGEMALSVYKVGPSKSPFELIGCFEDAPKMALSHPMTIVNNVEMCIEICRQNGLPYAGLQRGKHCFCGEEYNKSKKVHTCTMKCKSGDICGGHNSNSVYKVGKNIHDPVLRRTMELYEYIGCYSDRLFLRALDDYKGYVKSVDECISLCRQSGAQFAGLQFSKECWCGTNYNKYGRSFHCAMRCASGQICGGHWSNSVYRVGSPDCSCSVSGDPHYKTFDGQMIHFMGTCKYTLAMATREAPEYFAVEVKNEHRGNKRVSYTRMVDIKFELTTIRLLPGNKMLVDGHRMTPPLNNTLGVSVRYSGGWMTVYTDWGLQVQFDGRHRANVKVPRTFANKITGICGDCNGKKDDLRTKDGVDVSKDRDKFSKVGKSHQVKDDSDKPKSSCDVTDVNTYCTPDLTQACDVIKHPIFNKCRERISDERVKEYLDSCRIDACMYHNDSTVLNKVVCEAIEGFARECEQAGFPLDWRGKTKCGMTCPPNQVYQFDALVCQPSCTEQRTKCKRREEACVCKNGYILSGEVCVPRSQCGCIHKKKYMKANEEILDWKCQTKTICHAGGNLLTVKSTPCPPNSECRLQNGQNACICKPNFKSRGGKCIPEKADCSCSVSGDPHYKTFDGQMIHFMGICKYTLATSTKQAPHFFAVEVKNEHRGNTRVSYTRMVDVKLPNVTIRLLPGHKMLVNGERKSPPINDVSGFSAKFGGGWITVTTEWGLQVQFDGRHRANVKVPATFANQLSGICGDCNGKKDDLRTKEGKDVSKDHDRFSKVGKSHQVKDDSDKPEVRCNVTDVNTTCPSTQTQRCDVIHNPIFSDCREQLGNERVKEYLDSCKMDACIYHKHSEVNTVVCEAIEGFARECEKEGFPLDWRKVSKCVMVCPPNQVHEFDALVCQPSCTEPQPKCTERAEACVCKDGYMLSGQDCVPKSQCGCLNKGTYMKLNEVAIDSKCQTKTTCKAGGKLTIVKLAPCQDNSNCGVENGQRTCVCKEGFYRHHGKCFPQECEKTMADVVFLLDDSQHMLDSSSMKVKQFMKDIVRSFNIGDDRVRVGSVSYSTWVENNFHLNHHSNVSDLLIAIDNIKRRKRTSFIDLALDYLQTKSFTVANGDRAEAPNVAIIITDGKPETESKTLKAAESIKKSGVIMFVIAIGNSVQTSDFSAFSSEPSSEFVYTMDNFDALDRLKTKITRRICSVHVCDTKPCKNGGKCVPIGEKYKCECTDPFQGKDCSQMKPDCSCSVSGDPHYRTFDGQMIHFMGICKYTLATSTKGAPHFFAVEVKNEHRGNNRVSYTRMVDVRLKDVIIRLLPGNKMLVNGEKRSLPINNVLGFSAKFTGGWITVTTEWGLQVQFDGRHRANVKVPAIFINNLSGICGDCNGKKDDLRTKEGKDVSKDHDRFSKVGKSHQVKDDSDKPEQSCDVIDVNTTCEPSQTQRCNLIKHPMFHKCLEKLGNERVKEYVDSCNIDACIYHNDSQIAHMHVVCRAIEGFARECEQAGFPVDWRGVSKCDFKCPSNQVYRFNVLACQPSCSEPRQKCKEHQEACVCKDGYIFSDKQCVPISQCGCLHYGVYMKIDEEVIDSKCHLKTICKAGSKLVTKRLAPCHANSECSIANGQRTCVCKKGFEFRDGKCKVKPCYSNPCKNGGKCIEKGDDFSCLCKEPFYGNKCTKKKPDCSCSVSGDPHYKTFDGQMIHFMGICKYTLATSTKQAPHFFAVEVKNEHRGNNRVSYTRMVDVKLSNVTIRLSPGHKMLVNGEKRSLPISNFLGFSAKFSGGWITVTTEWGLQVQFDGRHRANVKVPATFANQLSGICGDCNGKKDDLRTKEGKDVSKDRNRFTEIGKSHQVKDDSDKPAKSCDESSGGASDCPAIQTRGCNVIENPIFNDCRKKLGSERIKEYLDSCKIDVCQYPNDMGVLCESIEGFVRQCEEAGFTLDWRGISKCEMKCQPNQVYRFNAFTCQPSCTEPQPKCKEQEEACVCKDGYILSGENCVPKSQCGCTKNGVYMKVNEEITDSKCQIKTICKAGNKLVTEKIAPCQANSECNIADGQRTCVCKKGFEIHNGKCKEKPACSCSVSGDPHYRTFDGQMIHFMGICKYTLATSTKQAPHFFAVEVKNEHRGNNRVSYTRMVDVKLSNVTIRLSPGHKMLVNGEKRSLPISNFLGFSAKFSGGWITVTTEWGLQVQFDGRHRANVKVPATFANQLSGICGDCNGKKDDLRTKEGKDVSKDRNRFTEIGKSHQVKDDSDKPAKSCDESSGGASDCPAIQTRGCNVIENPIFNDCRKKLGSERIKEYLDSCKIDVCQYPNDMGVLCESIEGFVRQCEEAGFTLDWRGISKCEMKCQPNQVYRFNAFTCQPSCTEPQPKCKEQEEACVCKDGYILSGENCVPKSQCGCTKNGVYMKVNEEITDSKCQIKTICKAGNKLVTEKIAPCQANSECNIADGQRTCVCKKGFEIHNGKCKEKPACSCSVSGDPHYRTFDGQMIHFMGICKYTLATSTKQAPHFFAVEVKNEHRGNNRVSYTRMVDVKLSNVTIRLSPGHKMLVNGEKRSLPINNFLGFSAKFTGGWITVTTEWGLQVQFDGRHRANVKVPATFANQLSGICGDCNGKKDDLRTKEGKDVSKDHDRFSKVGKSHQVKDDSDKPEQSCDVIDVNTTCEPSQTQRCNLIKHPMFHKCLEKLGNERVKEYVDSCNIDACIYHNDSQIAHMHVVCRAIEGFARECEQAGFPVDWRGVSKCDFKCPSNQVYRFNVLACQPSCSEPRQKCKEHQEACVCKDGYIFSDKQCVPISQCGCLHYGVYMKIDEEVIDSKCHLKTICKAGSKLVTKRLAPCHANSECSIANGQRTCVCKKGFEFRDGKCKVKPCYSNPCKNGGKCIEKGDDFSCLCKEPFYGNKCTKKKPDCSCSVSGDPHYKTFDGQMIHFMGICKYTLATSTKQAPHFFAVEVKNEHRGNNRVSYTRMVDVKLSNVTIRLSPGHKMLVNGEKRSLPISNFLGFSAKFSGGWITVTTEWGLQVQFDGRHRANVKVPATFANQLSGICGDCNGKKDDLRTKEGKDVSKDRNRFTEIGKSHQVKDDSDKPAKSCDESSGGTSDCPAIQTRGCNVIENPIFNDCRKKLGSERIKEYLDSCKIDVCQYPNDMGVLCESIEGFVRQCEEAGFTLDWRGISKCEMKCQPNQVYRFNAFTCQPSCTEPQPKCKEQEEACVCKDGYILSGENCVPKSQCGCTKNGVYMKVNEEITDSKCQIKTICKAGNKLVTEKIAPCQANSECNIADGQRTCVCKKGFEIHNGKCKEKPACSCSVSGDPHYRTFDGQMIHFMGICKYTLATSTKQAPHFFAVEVKNEHRGNNRVSYTRMVDVKLSNVTIRLSPGHKMLVNGEKRSLPINNFLGFSAKFSGGWITVTTEWGLQVQFDGRHRANVKVPATFANQLSGICGDCNGKKDDLRTKEGKDVSKDRNRFTEIGKSHQVKDDSDKPAKRCNGTDVVLKCTAAQTQSCNVIQHQIFDECKRKLGVERVEHYLNACKMDACIYRNDSKIFKNVVCEAIEGLVRECEQAGFLVNWRGVSKCAKTCLPNQVYQSNALVCQPSCTELQPKCTARQEACVCKKGYILSGEECVPEEKCGCLNKSNYMKLNEEIWDSNCQFRSICKPGGRLETQKLSPCQPYSTCSIENEQRTCQCDEGFVLRAGKCIPKVDPCKANPCKNEGKCIAVGLTRTCECVGPFDGDDCSKIASDCTCSASGDPHYKTFDGQWIHFMGTCKYTLATPKITSGLSYFAVEVKNEHRGNTRVAYTRLVDVKLYGVTIRMLQGNKLMVNGVLMTLPLTDYLGFSADFSAGWITVSTDYGIKVRFDGRHRVTVTVPNIYRHQLTGICGDCNGRKDDYRTKEGVDVSGKENKFSVIGESYRVLDDTDQGEKDCSAVGVVETCSPSETNACNLLKLPKGPFADCLAKLGSDATGYYDSCVIDSCAYRNNPKLRGTVLCQAFETLARKCEEIGIYADWRGPAKCPMSCPLNMEYRSKTSACQPSCSSGLPACDRGFIEGCVCKRGTILSGTECVPQFSCGCRYRGMYLPTGSSILLSDCSKKATCKPARQIEVEEGCGENAMCAVSGGTRHCVCRNGYLLFNGICRKVDVPQPPIVDPDFLGPVLHMFIRVSMAYLRGNPLVYKESTANIVTVDLKACATKCLKAKTCKSFNYDQLKKKCVLFSINAVKQSLVSSDCPYQDYYQLIDSKEISIRGATMLSCNHLESVQKVSSSTECQKLCADKKCKADEYSSFKKICSMTNDTRKSFGLTGDELWDYHAPPAMGQNFVKTIREMFQRCTRTPSNESLTNVSSLVGSRTLNSETSIFSSTVISLPEAMHLNQIPEEDGIPDEKEPQEPVDVKSNLSTFFANDTKSNSSHCDVQYASDTQGLSEHYRSVTPNTDQRDILCSFHPQTISSQSLNDESCTFTEIMCKPMFTRMSRSLNSISAVINDEKDIFKCPCVLCTTFDEGILEFAQISESKFDKSPHSSSADVSAYTSSISEISKTTLSTSSSDSTQLSDYMSSFCMSDTPSVTCASKNSCSYSTMPTISIASIGSGFYISGSSLYISSSNSRTSNTSNISSSTSSTNSTTGSSSSEMSVRIPFCGT